MTESTNLGAALPTATLHDVLQGVIDAVLAAISMNGDEPEYVLLLMRGNQPIEAVNVLTDVALERASEAVACALKQMLEARISEAVPGRALIRTGPCERPHCVRLSPNDCCEETAWPCVEAGRHATPAPFAALGLL